MDKRLTLETLTLVLCFLPDLQSLSNAVRVSKRFHTAYSAHPCSVRASVARNEVGPSLKQALRLVIAEERLVAGESVEIVDKWIHGKIYSGHRLLR